MIKKGLVVIVNQVNAILAKRRSSRVHDLNLFFLCYLGLPSDFDGFIRGSGAPLDEDIEDEEDDNQVERVQEGKHLSLDFLFLFFIYLFFFLYFFLK